MPINNASAAVTTTAKTPAPLRPFPCRWRSRSGMGVVLPGLQRLTSPTVARLRADGRRPVLSYEPVHGLDRSHSPEGRGRAQDSAGRAAVGARAHAPQPPA